MGEPRKELKDTIVAAMLTAEVSDGNAVLASLEAVADFAYATGLLEIAEHEKFGAAASAAFVDMIALKALEG